MLTHQGMVISSVTREMGVDGRERAIYKMVFTLTPRQFNLLDEFGKTYARLPLNWFLVVSC